MFLLKRTSYRGLLVLALVGLVQMHVASSVLDAEDGRSISTCIKTCNSLRDACVAACLPDCSLLFPPGALREACVEACETACVDESQSCKTKCNSNRHVPSPGAP